MHWGSEVKVRRVEILDRPFAGWFYETDIIGIGLSDNFEDSIEDLDTQVAANEERIRRGIDFARPKNAWKQLTNGVPIYVKWENVQVSSFNF